ncbi:FadR family transcriptional regulator [Halomonas sp. H33-56]|uniref:FadR/GntR family transcriptional regulator n=1 Tax=unclassified Halomonas TaxID=2609666 RepID=UPI000F5D6DA8|nr:MULTISPECIES: FadR/GntR family transcriptional regulator [unclassified Halomonas]MBY5941697.1 FadR family transcriptional regulator [Halomonas sp. DP5N14-9]RQW72653.1 FadR family transcriptional regulator [Halomonas sp. YLB-10]
MLDSAIREGESVNGYQRVFEVFRERVLNGEWRPGDRLPSERELALELKVGRPLLREVMRSLEMLGVLDIRHGKGAYVAKADFKVLSDFFAFYLAQEKNALDDVMQARIAIECQAVRLACDRATDNDIARIETCFKQLMATLEDPEQGGRADYQFHLAIVEASHCQSLMTLYHAISALLLKSHVQRRQITLGSDEVIEAHIDSHRQVFLAIVEGDGDKANQRLREHFSIGDELRRKSIIAAYTQEAEAGLGRR